MSRIVRLTREHLSGVAELEQLCFPAEPWSESSLEVLCREHGIGYVALDEDETVLAYVGMTYAADEGSITNVATHPRARRQGLGRAVVHTLMQEGIALARAWRPARTRPLRIRSWQWTAGWKCDAHTWEHIYPPA